MKIVLRLATACLAVCLMLPRSSQAGGDTAMSPYEVGAQLLAKKEYRTALKYFQKALGRNDVRAHYGMGLAYEATGRDRDALKQYQLFVKLSLPDAERSDAAQRAAAVEERLRRDTASAAELLGEGKRLFQAGDYREAERVLLKAAARDESQPEIHFMLGEVYLKLEAYGKAKAAYSKAKGYY